MGRKWSRPLGRQSSMDWLLLTPGVRGQLSDLHAQAHCLNGSSLVCSTCAGAAEHGARDQSEGICLQGQCGDMRSSKDTRYVLCRRGSAGQGISKMKGILIWLQQVWNNLPQQAALIIRRDANTMASSAAQQQQPLRDQVPAQGTAGKASIEQATACSPQ